MATSFAAYASQYLTSNAHGNGPGNVADTVSSSHPMFFSFTTDEGSRHGADTDLEDDDDPHLNMHAGESQSYTGHRQPHTQSQMQGQQNDDDPYLKLDDEVEPEQPGWLAHLTHSPGPRRSGSSSASRLRSGVSDEDDSEDGAPPAELMAARPVHAASARASSSKGRSHPNPPHSNPHINSNVQKPNTNRLLMVNYDDGPTPLTDSLIPRTGTDAFHLPDPRHTHRSRRKYHEHIFTTVFLACVSFALLLCIILLFTTRRPPDIPAAFLPYAIMVRTVPVLTLVTLMSAAAAYAHVWLLRVFVGPVMVATEVAVPATLGVSAVWAFVGSFMWEEGVEPTWGETVGLRLFSLVLLVLCLISARRLLHLPRHIHHTSSTLTLATQLLINNPFLAVLSPALLLAMLVASIPFITAVFRLLLIGYGTQKANEGWEWHVRAWANWGIVAVLAVWLWSWAVVRGILRTTAASVVAAWYFADPSLPPPPPNSTHTIHAALTRSSGPSLGTITLSALLLTLLRLLTLILLLLTRLPSALLAIPFASYGMSGVGAAVGTGVARWVVPGVGWLSGYVDRWKARVSRYVLVYCGITGVGFWEGAGRASVLVSGAEVQAPQQEDGQGQTQGRSGRPARARRGARKVDFASEPSLALLTISPLTLTLPFSLLTYLFVAHTLGAPNEALGAALLAAGTTGVVGVFCVGLVRDCADTLYLCYCIDKAHNERRREEVFIAFEYDDPSAPANATVGLPGSMVLPMHRQYVAVPGGPAGGRGVGQSTSSSIIQQPTTRSNMYGHGPETIVPRSPLGATIPGAAAGRPRRRETLFDALAEAAESEEDEDDSVDDEKTKRTIRPSLRPRDEDDDDELDPFSRSAVEDEEEDAEATRMGRGVGKRLSGGAVAYPFATTQTHSPGTSPRSAGMGGVGMGIGLGKTGFGFVGGHGHQRSGSGSGAAGLLRGAAGGPSGITIGGGGGNGRMLSSTQELNMKSQFLMNMRPFGDESEVSNGGLGASGGSAVSAADLAASGTGGTSGYEGYMEDSGMTPVGGDGAGAGVGVGVDSPGGQGAGNEGHGNEKANENEKSAGEESLLGPGSGFFN